MREVVIASMALACWAHGGPTLGPAVAHADCGVVRPPAIPTRAGRDLFFRFDDGLHGEELWASDGTVRGTRLVVDLVPGPGPSAPSAIMGLGTKVYFTPLGQAPDPGGLWRSDGTRDGTVRIKDLALGMPGCSGEHSLFAEMGGRLYFAASDGRRGMELWRTDGTAAGTTLVADIAAGPTGSEPGSLLAVHGVLTFTAWDATHGRRLWRTDGTGAGTVPIGRLGKDRSSLWIEDRATIGGARWFVAGEALWRTDGTVAGTRRLTPHVVGGPVVAFPGVFFVSSDREHGHGTELWVADLDGRRARLVREIRPGLSDPGIGSMVAFGDRLFFTADDGVRGREPWLSDGSRAGTRPIADIRPGPDGSAPEGPMAIGERLVLYADDGTHGRQLWSTDGTAAGTRAIATVQPGSTSWELQPTRLGDALLFQGDDGIHGPELWRTDGTAAGTFMALDVHGGGGGSGLTLVRRMDGQALLVANEGQHGIELWRTDGTTPGTSLVRVMAPSGNGWLSTIGAARGRLLLQLWTATERRLLITDGTSAGSRLVNRVPACYPPSSPYFDAPRPWNGRLWFTAWDPTTGMELWQSDGTMEGTHILQDLVPGCAGARPQVAAGAERLLMTAFDPVHGREPWISDGTPSGTGPLLDLHPGERGSATSDAAPFRSGFLLASGRLGDGHGRETLWHVDGATGVSVPVLELPSGESGASIQVVGDSIFLRTWTEEGHRLWHSDGTASGTVPVADFIDFGDQGLGGTVDGSGENGWSDVPSPFRRDPAGAAGPLGVAVGTQLLFVADGGGGPKLWRSDGTRNGTVPLTGAGTQRQAADPAVRPVVVDGIAYFVMDDGFTGRELWRSDGTVTGTRMVADIRRGRRGSAPTHLTAVGDRLYLVANDGAHGREVWESDGTPTGTRLVRDLVPAGGAGTPDHLTALGARLFFQADDGRHGSELWVTDGSARGTHLVRDLVPGPRGSWPQWLTAMGDTLFFERDAGRLGWQLWRTDGTPEGTVRLHG